MVAWVMGLAIFIDDYLNALLIGHALRPVTDRLRVPRERLAYVIDATAAPVCILVPLSTWAVYVAGLLESTGAAEPGQGMRAYLGVIPWAFYGWIAVLLVPLTILGWLPAWGMMRRADRRVAEGGSPAPPGSPTTDESGDVPALPGGQIGDFLVPVAALVVATVLSKADALHGVVWALVALVVHQGLIRRRMTATNLADGACRGIGSMVPAPATILLAFLIKDVNDRLGLTQTAVAAVAPLVSAAAFPAVAFAVLSLVTFATGSFWGTYAVALPIIVPLARELHADLPMTIGAVVSAGAFGSHACFFGDTTVLASQASGCENLAHAGSQLPYVLLGAALTIVAYLACGYASSSRGGRGGSRGHQPARPTAAVRGSSGGHGIRTHNPFRGTTFPVSPLAIRLPSKQRFFSAVCPAVYPGRQDGRCESRQACTTLVGWSLTPESSLCDASQLRPGHRPPTGRPGAGGVAGPGAGGITGRPAPRSGVLGHPAPADLAKSRPCGRGPGSGPAALEPSRPARLQPQGRDAAAGGLPPRRHPLAVFLASPPLPRRH